MLLLSLWSQAFVTSWLVGPSVRGVVCFMLVRGGLTGLEWGPALIDPNK